jgi:uncharacterized peroxidase-related enzyme
LCRFAELLTRTPYAVRPQDLNTLRPHGLTDRDILDVVEVVSYFNYINRVADALGVDPEPEMRRRSTSRSAKTIRRDETLAGSAT